ncbi:MAG: hypothetical protein SFV51_09995 [Bryobacteraceae bacterium]|nr:hypothetical protein [Bryobacteraceae bacterium]
MRMILMASLLVAGAWAEEPAAKKKAPVAKAAAKKPAVKKAAPEAVKVPRDAVRVSPGMWKWKDPKGIVWVYNETPFGIMKGEEPKDQEPEKTPTDWKVTDEGETLAFERPWPFGGVNRWTKNKNDLTAIEKAVWEQHRKAQAAR